MIAATVLDTRSSVVFAALVITWLATAGLVVIVGNLHVRLRRLEQARTRGDGANPYARFLGQQVDGHDNAVLLFVAPACRACDALLRDIARSTWSTPLTVLSTAGTHVVSDALPSPVDVLDDDGMLADRLGVTVTPFAVIVAGGVVVHAAPVGAIAALRHISQRAATHDVQPPMSMEVPRHAN